MAKTKGTEAPVDPRALDPRAQSTPTSDITLVVTQVRSSIGCKANQRATLKSLGLRKIRQTVEREDTPQNRGMIHTVRHLVSVEEVGS
jgi:large subunit ribosomal protein L30